MPDPVMITLTASEARMAALIGVERQLAALSNGNRDRPGVKPAVRWGNHIEGAAAELAFAKVMGWYWDGSVNVFHTRTDVRNVEVRGRPRHDYDLPIRPHDKRGVYVLVTGQLPGPYRVHGWAVWPGAPTYEAAYDEDRAPAQYVRQADLQDLDRIGAAAVLL